MDKLVKLSWKDEHGNKCELFVSWKHSNFIDKEAISFYAGNSCVKVGTDNTVKKR